MAILLQYLPVLLTLYWAQFSEMWSDYLYERMVAHCPHHLLVQLAEHFDFAPLEAGCAAFHHQQGPGAPETYGVAVLARCLLVEYLYDLSLRELEQRLYSDGLVRWFVGLGAFDEVPDHSTLERFELWVRDHQPRLYGDGVLAQIDAQFPHSREHNQVGDTYAMLANAAEEEIVPRLRHTVHELLEAAVIEIPAQLAPIVAGMDWTQLFGAAPERGWFGLDASQRQQRLQATVLAAQDLQQRFAGRLAPDRQGEHPTVCLWLGYLGKILHDEVVITATAGADGRRVRLRTAKEVRNDPDTSLRLVSATDPEATHRVHGRDDADISFGYNIQLSAATDGYIRETQAYTGGVPDQAGVAALLTAQMAHQGSCPPKLIYDAAAGAGKTRADVARVTEGKTQLVAKLPPDNRCSPRFGPYDFTLSTDGLRLTCPHGQTTTTFVPTHSADGRDFAFPSTQCWQGTPPAHWQGADLSARCPLWEQCRAQREGPRAKRTVFISAYRDQVLAARAYNQTPAFQTELQQRPLIERIIFLLTHYYGARHCRRRGLANADWQAKMCAVSYNLRLFVRQMDTANRAQRSRMVV